MTRLFGILFFFICSSMSLCYGDEALPTNPPRDPEIRFLAAGISNYRRQFKCGSANLKISQTVPKEIYDVLRNGLKVIRPDADSTIKNLPIGDITTYKQAKFLLAQDRLLVEISSNSPNDPIILEKIVANEIQAEMLRTQKPPGTNVPYSIGLVQYPIDVVGNGVWIGREESDPRYYGYFYSSRPLDAVLMDENISNVILGETVYAGAKCIKVEASPSKDRKVVFYVDKEHSYLIRHWEEFRVRSGLKSLRIQLDIPTLVNSGGVWLPGKVERKEFVNVASSAQEDGKPGGPLKQVVISKTITITNFSSDCASEEEFKMEWPIGTMVTDFINNKKFSAGSTKSKTLYNKREDEVTKIDPKDNKEDDLKIPEE